MVTLEGTIAASGFAGGFCAGDANEVCATSNGEVQTHSTD
jgi:hypothetical protein